MPPTEKQPSRLAVTATVLFYMLSAICMIIVNKWVLIKTSTPLFFLLAQLLIAVLMFLVTNALGLFNITLKLDWDVCTGLWPMIALNVVGLSANNYCLKYVDASFYQVARGLILPLTVILSLIFLKASRPSIRILLACGVVTGGFFVGVFLDAPSTSLDATNNTSTTSTLGIIFGLISSLTTASHAIVIKRSLTLVNGDALELAWYSNVLSSLVLIPVIWLVGEGGGIVELLTSPLRNGDNGDLSALGRFLWGSLITGLVGWTLSIAGVLSIKITSPITHMISSAVRGILQSAMGVWAFGEVITTGRGTSILVILTGSMYYTWVKNDEVLQQREREAQHRGGATGQTDTPLLNRQEEEASALVFDARIGREEDLEGGYDLGETRHRASRSIGSRIPLQEAGTSDIRTEKTFEQEK